VTAVAEPIGTLETWRTEGTDAPDTTPVLSASAAAESAIAAAAFPSPDLTPVFATFTSALRESGFGGRMWTPWVFEPAVLGVGISIVGFGASGFGPALVSAGIGVAPATRVFPAWGVTALVSRGQVIAQSTPLWEEAAEVRLITPGLRPRVLRVREAHSEPTTRVQFDQRTGEARLAVAELMRWLRRSREEVASICGFSLRTSRYWDVGKTPRPSTVRHLFDVHALVSSLVRALGMQGARAWLDQRGTRGARRIEELRTDAGLTTVLREASRFIFAEVPLPEVARPIAEEAVIEAASAEAYQPAEFQTAPRRPRRAPPKGGA
jgi:hypothetical protein